MGIGGDAGIFSISSGLVIANEAKQALLLQRDCHSALRLAMTQNSTSKGSSELIEKLRMEQ